MFGPRPSLRLGVTAMNWTAVADTVREREADLGVLEISDLGDEAADLVIEPLREHPAFFAARAGHPLAARAGLTLADILAYPLVLIGRTPKQYVALFAAAREAAQAGGTVHAAFPALLHESPSLALRAVAASDALVGRDRADGRCRDAGRRHHHPALARALDLYALRHHPGARAPPAAGGRAVRRGLREADDAAWQEGRGAAGPRRGRQGGRGAAPLDLAASLRVRGAAPLSLRGCLETGSI